MDAIVKIGAKALIRKGETSLILKKTEKGTDPLIGWETPGGHMDGGEDLNSCLEREIEEETGLKVKVICPFATFTIHDSAGTFVGVNFLCDYISGEVTLDKNEHYDFHWATLPEIRDLTGSLGLQKEMDKYEEFLINSRNI